MENYTADKIREEFIAPLMGLVADFTEEVKQLDLLVKSGTSPKDYLPLNATTAKKSIGFLKKLRRELHAKIEGVQDGTFLYREKELAKKREKYSKEKKNDK